MKWQIGQNSFCNMLYYYIMMLSNTIHLMIPQGLELTTCLDFPKWNHMVKLVKERLQSSNSSETCGS
jgi:hypothetical protein